MSKFITAEVVLQNIIEEVNRKVTETDISMEDLNVAAVTLINVMEREKMVDIYKTGNNNYGN